VNANKNIYDLRSDCRFFQLSLPWLCWLVWGRQVKNKKLGRDHATLSPLSSYRNPKPGMMLTLQAQGKELVVILRDKGQGWSRGSLIFNKFINDIERVSFRGAVFIQLEISYEKQSSQKEGWKHSGKQALPRRGLFRVSLLHCIKACFLRVLMDWRGHFFTQRSLGLRVIQPIN